MTIPKLLFHYTSINALALILKTKAIKFNRLDLVNDRKEGVAKDLGNLAHSIFISSWTETIEENFALWNMYTPEMRGVRIELELPIFPVYELSNNIKTIIPESRLIDRDNSVFIYGCHIEQNPFKVEYTNDEDKLFPNVHRGKHGQFDIINMGSLGRYKREIWQIENEWRYLLDIMPLENDDDISFEDRIQHHTIKPSINNYFVLIEENSFLKMKVILGPKCIDGDLEIVQALIEKYNPTAQVEISYLKDHIR